MSGLGAVVLTQEKVQNVQLGGNAKIHCARTGGKSSWILAWYQQKPGSAPKFLLADSNRATSLPSRFTYTDNGYNEYLDINGVTADDEAVYYCACHGCPSSADHHSAPT